MGRAAAEGFAPEQSDGTIRDSRDSLLQRRYRKRDHHSDKRGARNGVLLRSGKKWIILLGVIGGGAAAAAVAASGGGGSTAAASPAPSPADPAAGTHYWRSRFWTAEISSSGAAMSRFPFLLSAVILLAGALVRAEDNQFLSSQAGLRVRCQLTDRSGR